MFFPLRDLRELRGKKMRMNHEEHKGHEEEVRKNGELIMNRR